MNVARGVDGAVVLGNNSTASAPHTGPTSVSGTKLAGSNPTSVVSVGSVGAERQITNVATGVIAAGSTDATNGGQLFDAVTTINKNVAAVQKEARSGIAATAAMTSAPMPSAGGKTTWAANMATFRSQQAMGASLTHRLDTNKPIAITGSFGWGMNTGDIVARAGVMGEF